MMLSKKAFVANRTIQKSKNKRLLFLLAAAAAAALLAASSFLIRAALSKRVRSRPSIAMLKEKWKEEDFQGVFDTATPLLEKEPFNNAVLTYRGYSAFYLALSETDSSKSQELIDEAVRSLRLSLIHAKDRTLPQICYMLGKTYFYKNSIFSYHYYADLACEYLSAAQKRGYKAKDISEYLGLSYAQLGMTMESIAAFSEALLVRESDTLLLSIAEQYSKAGQAMAAKQYLFQVIQKSEDDSLLERSRSLLGNILVSEKDFDGAKKEFDEILKKNENSAEAHYGLGLVYEAQGNLARARSEWRKTLRLQANHSDAIEKIQYYR